MLVRMGFFWMKGKMGREEGAVVWDIVERICMREGFCELELGASAELGTLRGEKVDSC